MKSKLLIPCFLLAFFTLLPFAEAAEQKFTDFTIEVPLECTGTENEGTVKVTCPNDSFFSLSLRRVAPASGKSLAAELTAKYKGNTPMLNDYGNYYFDVELGEGKSYRVELIEKEPFLLVYISGNYPEGWPEKLSTAFDSITGNSQEIDSFIKEKLLE